MFPTHKSQGGERLAMSYNLGYYFITASSILTKKLKLCYLEPDGKMSIGQLIFSNMGSSRSSPLKYIDMSRVVSN